MMMVGNIIKCACGCGEETTDKTDAYKSRRYIRHHHLWGKNHWNYKTGHEMTVFGYISVLHRGYHPRKHKGKVAEHILIKEREIGRLLRDDEIVHHIDGNKLNNNPSNLMLTTYEEHPSLTGYQRAKRNNLKCPTCNSDYVIRNGFYRHLDVIKQIFLCRNCNEEFRSYGVSKRKHKQHCILCDSSDVTANGIRNNKQRFKCRDCERHFTIGLKAG